MKVAQRTVLLVGVFLIIISCMMFVMVEAEDYYTEKWETVQLERFINNLCRNGKITENDYILFHDALSGNGNITEIRVEEYLTEQDLQKNNYYVPVVWEEIRDILMKDNYYCFTSGSIVQVRVTYGKPFREQVICRVGRIKERVNNGT